MSLNCGIPDLDVIFVGCWKNQQQSLESAGMDHHICEIENIVPRGGPLLQGEQEERNPEGCQPATVLPFGAIEELWFVLLAPSSCCFEQ
eukprot:CAMPEP_0174366964 /NCGR_PEP_ID=MMETSP0811_2-20130205/83254_1 /TAXON_ID=73025 ORGANISM="Eutreptiella gymnastica-like, Strain CCMP1594" /NCGR_SAMPLE_ID=MMETSP0811_2 /ASSEMBLY_ACC=CAM_ASM_000667 /LENGTH=88 /DNA_ID=CAMNT_0015509033 /DNA_START=2170 /DNA_END=2436 /DNA_ORIENTATION=-